MKKYKILITAGALGMGGLENQLVYLGKHIDRSKFQIDYTSTDKDAYYKQDIIESGCGFYVIPDPRKEGTMKYCKALFQIMKDGKYDVVHSQELFHSGIEMFLAWLAKIPKRIAHSHSTQDGSKRNELLKSIYHQLMRMSILLFATDYLACSKIAGQFLYGKKILNNKRFRVVVNSVEINHFFKESKQQIIPKKSDWKYVIHVGRFADVKNHDFMLDIAKQFKRNNLKIAFVFVGDGELYNHCLERVKKEELQNYVIFLGQRRDVAAILEEGDAFVLPSLYEGMPLSVIEAQTAGLPCLIADHIAEEVDFGINLIYRCSLKKDSFVWAKKIEEIVGIKHPEKGTIIKAVHRKGFDVTDFQKNMCKIYEE